MTGLLTVLIEADAAVSDEALRCVLRDAVAALLDHPPWPIDPDAEGVRFFRPGQARALAVFIGQEPGLQVGLTGPEKAPVLVLQHTDEWTDMALDKFLYEIQDWVHRKHHIRLQFYEGHMRNA